MRLLWQQIPSSEITTIYCNSKFDGIVFDDDSCWYLDDCNDTVLEEPIVINKIYKQFDLFGREYSNMKFQIEVLNDGSVKKKIMCNPFY